MPFFCHQWTDSWKVLIYGQLIALSLACCSAALATLQDMTGMKGMPLFQIAGGYFFLGFYMTTLEKNAHYSQKDNTGSIPIESTNLIDHPKILTIHHSEETTHHFPFITGIKLHSPWYFYAVLAFLDVQANFFVVLSFRYTSLMNSNLLTSLSVLSVFISSKVILKRSFSLHHFIGGFLMLIGAFLIVSSDAKVGSKGEDDHGFGHSSNDGNTYFKSQNYLGDFFAVSAALVFGLNDTLAEYCIQNSTVGEYLGMLGIFGCLFSIGESLIFEQNQIRQSWSLFTDAIMNMNNSNSMVSGDQQLKIQSPDEDVNFFLIALIWAAYIIFSFVFYSMASHFLTTSDATLFTLSLQFSNMWTVIFSIVIQHIFPSHMFYYAVVLIFSGVLIYEKGLALIEGINNWIMFQ